LARVGRERLDIAPLALCEDGVKSKRRLTRPGQAGEHNKRIAGYDQINVFQVVDPSTFDRQH
jgi:hypothetical protein